MDDRGSGGPTLRYMMDEGKGGGMLRGITPLVVVIVVVGALLGWALSRSDLLNPDSAVANAHRTEVQTDALAAKNRLELEQQRAVEAQKLEQSKRWAEIWEAVMLFSVPGFLTAFVVLAVGVAVNLICKGIAQLQQRPTADRRSVPPEQPRAKVIPFPGLRGGATPGQAATYPKSAT